MALANNQSLMSELGLPENFVPSCAVALGKTNEKYTIREIPIDRITSKTLV